MTIPVAHANVHYWIPTFGVGWPSQRIYVRIPSEPGNARDVALKAIAIWNQAQEWFRETYFPSADVYTLVIGGKHASVLTEFTDYWTVSNYCPTMPFGVQGCTHLRWDDADNITMALIFLDTSGLTSSGSSHEPIFLALHEFGHALGLPDYPSSSSSPCPFEDLMCLYYPDEYPSTLDLYALHQLAAGIRATDIFLPPYIPYAYYMPISNTTSTSARTQITQAGPQSGCTLNSGPLIIQRADNYLNWRLDLSLAATVAITLLVLSVTLKKRKRRRGRYGPP
jgi:hypothetical protein